MFEHSFSAKELLKSGKLAKDTIVITSLDVAKENEKMRSAIKSNNSILSIDLAKANLSDSVRENDCQELAKIIKLIPIQSDQSATWSLIESAIHHIEPIATSNDVIFPKTAA